MSLGNHDLRGKVWIVDIAGQLEHPTVFLIACIDTIVVVVASQFRADASSVSATEMSRLVDGQVQVHLPPRNTWIAFALDLVEDPSPFPERKELPLFKVAVSCGEESRFIEGEVGRGQNCTIRCVHNLPSFPRGIRGLDLCVLVAQKLSLEYVFLASEDIVRVQTAVHARSSKSIFRDFCQCTEWREFQVRGWDEMLLSRNVKDDHILPSSQIRLPSSPLNPGNCLSSSRDVKTILSSSSNGSSSANALTSTCSFHSFIVNLMKQLFADIWHQTGLEYQCIKNIVLSFGTSKQWQLQN